MKIKSIAGTYWISLALMPMGYGLNMGTQCSAQGIDLGVGQSDIDIRRRRVNVDVPGDRRSVDDTTKRDGLRISPTTPNMILPESERTGTASPEGPGLQANGAAMGLTDGFGTPANGQNFIQLHIVERLLIDQQSLINLAQYGRTRSDSSEVRQLAEMIIQDHEALVETLATHADRLTYVQASTSSIIDPSVGRPVEDLVPLTAAQADAAEVRSNNLEQRRRIADVSRERGAIVTDDVPVDGLNRRPVDRLVDRIEDRAGRVADRTGEIVGNARERLDAAIDTDRGVRNRISRRSESNAAVLPLDESLELHRQISSKLGALVREDLTGKTGYEFDASFIGLLVAAHLQQEATLEVMGGHVVGDLQQTINHALVQARKHRVTAERLRASVKP